jgi:hypothetical protein
MGFGTNYQGNPVAVETPSPAPGPRVLPVVYLPSDLDANTYASIQQAHKTEADFIGHIQTAVGLDVPVLNASGNPFTTVTYTAFGGTVTPSGSVHISDGTRFMIQIQVGGAVGTATFKTSVDGGNTFGATQTTAASMTDATSGITLAFSGTFTANGTAAFRAAFTPQAQWRDQAGNLRSIIDHLGFRSSSHNTEFREEWLTVQNAVTTSTLALANPIWSFAVAGANSSLSSFADGTGGSGGSFVGNGMKLTPGTANTNAAVLFMAQPIANLRVGWPITVFEFEFCAVTSLSNVTRNLGMNSQPNANAINAATPQGAGAWFTSANGGVWTAVTQSGTGTNTTTVSTVSPVLNTAQQFRLVIAGPSSQYGTLTALFFINEALIAQMTTTMPGVGSYTFFVAGFCTGAATAIGHIPPLYLTLNRWQASTAL